MRHPERANSSNARVVALRTERDEIALLNRIISAQGEIVAAANNPKEVVDLIVRRTQELTRSEGAALEVLDGDDLVYFATSGVAADHVGRRIPAQNSLAGLCIAESRTLRCDDAEHDARVNQEACRQVGLRSMLVAPLLHAGKPIGALKVMSPYACAYNATDVRTLERMAVLIGSTLGSVFERQNASQRHDRIDAAAHAEMQANEDWKTRIRTLIAERRIETVFQPVVRLTDMAVLGYEALSRFPAGTGTPDVWLGKASALGLGIALEMEALRSALEHLRRIPAPLTLAVNLSPEALSAPVLDDVLRPYDTSRLILEITEHSTVEDYALLRDRVLSLQKQGLRLAIDDAGAGFASLRHILNLTPDIIKLDISLTRGVDQDTRRQVLVSAILTFAQGTSTHVVVEGIETEGELAALQDLGVESGQGYLLGRPDALPSAQ